MKEDAAQVLKCQNKLYTSLHPLVLDAETAEE